MAPSLSSRLEGARNGPPFVEKIGTTRLEGSARSMQYQFCYLELFTCRIYHAIMIHCLLPKCRTDIFAVSPLPNALHTRSRPRPLGGGGGRGLSCGLRRRYRKGRDKLRKTAQGKEERSWSEVGLTDALIESERPLTHNARPKISLPATDASEKCQKGKMQLFKVNRAISRKRQDGEPI